MPIDLGTGIPPASPIPENIRENIQFNDEFGKIPNTQIPNIYLGERNFSYAAKDNSPISIYTSTVIDGTWVSSDPSYTTLSIGGNVTSIGSYAFSDCYGFNGDLVLPNSLTSIGSYAFGNCYGFTGAYIDCPATAIDPSTFGNTNFTTIYVRPAPNTPSGWTIGSTQFGKTVAEWTNYPNYP